MFVAVSAGAALLAWQPTSSFGNKPPATTIAKPPPLVSVALAETVDLPIKIATQGHLVTLNQVDVRPQFNGAVRGVHFHEGDEVAAGQLLFTLDASDATTQAERAQAQAAQMKAQVEEAQRDLLRSRQLAKDNFISASVVDTAAGKVDSLQAQYRTALADIESARTALGRTRITAPIAGLSGQLSVHPGSLAQQSAAAAMVSLVQVDPIGVDFTLPEASLADVLAARAVNKVTVTLESPDGKALAGRLVFINNTVNTDTATINLKASFANPRKLLWPGAFVRVTVDAGSNRGAIVLPPQAVIEGPKGRFVYLLAADSSVSTVPVTLLRVQDHQAVVQGLKGGEQVVTEGNQALRPGMKVRIAKRPGEAASDASSVAKSGA